MRETKENRIAWWRSDFAQGVCVFGGVMLLALFFEWVSKVVLPLLGNPSLLMISDKIVVTDLLVGVFTAQVTMITVAITFTGLLVQLFGSKEEYLGMSLREAVFQRRYGRLSLPTISIVAITLPITSYYFVAKGFVSALLVVFVINIWIVAILLKHYLMYAISVAKVHQDIRDIIERKMLRIIEMENETFINGDEVSKDFYTDMAVHLSAIESSLLKDIKGDDLLNYQDSGKYLIQVGEKVANISTNLNKSLMFEGLMRLCKIVSLTWLCKVNYKLSLTFLTSHLSSCFNRDKTNELNIDESNKKIRKYIKSILEDIERFCLDIMGEGLGGDFKLIDLFNFLTELQEFLLSNNVELHSVKIVFTVFEQWFDANKNKRINKKPLTEMFIDNYYQHVSSNLISLRTKKVADKRTMLLELYVFELTGMAQYLFENRHLFSFRYIFTAESHYQTNTDNPAEEFAPYLAVSLVLIIIHDGYQESHIGGFKLIEMFYDNGRQENIIKYSERHLHRLDVCEISYKTLYQLKPLVADECSIPEAQNFLPDIIIVLVCIFFHDQKDYHIMVKWFRNIFIMCWDSENSHYAFVRSLLLTYPKEDNTSTYAALFNSFIGLYELEDHFKDNRAKIISNLEKLNDAILEFNMKK